MLFNEPKLLKYGMRDAFPDFIVVSVLFNEPKLLKSDKRTADIGHSLVSVLFNEPKLLKSLHDAHTRVFSTSFSALQRAEIAEIGTETFPRCSKTSRFSALQRAEIAEIPISRRIRPSTRSFSALQRAEIAEMILKPMRGAMLHMFLCSSTSRNC